MKGKNIYAYANIYIFSQTLQGLSLKKTSLRVTHRRYASIEYW